MSELTNLFENYPGFAAVIIAVLAGAAFVFDATFWGGRTMAGFSLVLGLLGLLACFAGAVRKGPLDIGIVVVSAVAFVAFANYFLRKRAKSSNSSAGEN